jgi:AbrB family looped-hinge helix DNA binding protein
MASNLTTAVTSKGQVTIPVEVRRLLGLQRHDRVRFTVRDGEVFVERAHLSLEEAFAAVPPRYTNKDWKEIRQAVAEERVAAYLRKFPAGGKIGASDV